jgi:spore germination cell wall hydrolase CwlJ-like protein
MILPLALATALSLPISPQQHTCLANAVWNEARGESLAGQKSVIEVVKNRVVREKSSYCKVLKRKGQFPWAQKIGMKPLTPKMMAVYIPAMLYPPVLNDSRYVYFNTTYQHGYECQQIGGHIFCREGK